MMLESKKYSFLNKSTMNTMRDKEMTLYYISLYWCTEKYYASEWQLLLFQERNCYSTSTKHQTTNLLLARAFRFMTRYTAFLLERSNCIRITYLTKTNYENSRKFLDGVLIQVDFKGKTKRSLLLHNAEKHSNISIMLLIGLQ